MIYLILFFYSMMPSLEGTASFQDYSIHFRNISVTIHGKTNINQFECAAHDLNLLDTLLVSQKFRNDTLIFDGLRLEVPIKGFDCGMDLMTRDFYDFLLAEDYPEMMITIDHMVIDRATSVMGKVSVTSSASIDLCGTTKEQLLEKGYVIDLPDDQIRLTSNDQIRFTDFELIPPTKFFGAVRVSDELDISLTVDIEVKPL